VSPQDRRLLEEQNWCFGGKGYAMGWNVERQKTTFLHSEILQPPEGKVPDHINKNQFDNRRENLRVVTYSQNNMNRRSESSVGVRGVQQASAHTWRAQITVDRKVYRLGSFKSKEAAAAAYNEAARRLHGEFAQLNDL
jgi:hypothetical protein